MAEKNPGGNVSDDLQAAHERRTTVPGSPGVDARLDNRTGSDRPPLETFPAKPQQIDGPDVAHQAEHTRATLAARATGDDVERKGQFSPGPHGLSDESLRAGKLGDGSPTLYGTESLTASEAAAGSPTDQGSGGENVDAGQSGDVDVPAGNASLEDWQRYARTQGATDVDLDGVGRDDLRARYAKD